MYSYEYLYEGTDKSRKHPIHCNYGGAVCNFVSDTGGEGGSPRFWNIQNLHAVPP